MITIIKKGGVYMSDDEKIIKPVTEKSKNKFWNIFSSIIKSIIVLLIIGVIMLWISMWGANIYTKKSWERNYTGGLLYHEYLNPFYGLMGIIIYILINCFGFFSYNYIIDKLKNCKITISKFLFIVFSFLINLVMLIEYSGLFGDFSFKNNILLNWLKNITITRGMITFPIIFLIIYNCRKKDESKN